MQDIFEVIDRSEKYQIIFIPVEHLRFFPEGIPTLNQYKRRMGE